MHMPTPIQLPAESAALPRAIPPTAAWGKAVPLSLHRDDFARLRRLLARPGRFALVIAQCGVAGYRDALIDAASAAASTEPPARWQLADRPDPDAVPGQLAEHAAGAGALHLLGLDRWPGEDLHRLWRNLNVRRERLAAELRLPVVLWLDEAQIRQLADQAPDLWTWRAAVLDFTPPGTTGGEAIWSEPDEPTLLDREHARERLRQLDAYLARQPDAEAEPDLLLEAANRLAALGEAAAARRRAEQALRGFRARGNGGGAALALMELARARRTNGRVDEAAALLREALSAAESAFGHDHPTTAQALADLAQALEETGYLAEAEPLLRRALAIDERVFGPRHPRVARHLDQLARVLHVAGRIAESLAALDRAVAILVAAARESDDVSLKQQMAGIYSNRGLAHADIGALDVAITDYDAAIKLGETLCSALGAHWPPAMQNALATVYSNRGNAHADRGALDAATADYDAAIRLGETLRTALGAQWPQEMQNDLAGIYTNRGAAHADRGAPDAAIADYDAAITLRETLRTALGAQWPPAMQNDLGAVYSNRGLAYADRGALDAAIADYDAAIGLGEALLTTLGAQWPPAMQHHLAVAYMNRGIAHGNAGRHDDALADFEHAVAISRSLVAAHPDIPAWRDTLARAQQNLAQARRLAAGDAGE
ncbi:tetratricopeptide repeat protein [Thiohalocapsa sp. ML1]|uniref:tetratricopeptide repeat protein n=1 Tax=Thiohalocapsa sp. ML1 TaxID=1431688 RepID=UPI0007320CAB|nr:tetratricopeptide repeat protein [Thiohalocapsa sp. ML1]